MLSATVSASETTATRTPHNWIQLERHTHHQYNILTVVSPKQFAKRAIALFRTRRSSDGVVYSRYPSITGACPSLNERIFLTQMDTSGVDHPVIQTQEMAHTPLGGLPWSFPSQEELPFEGFVIEGYRLYCEPRWSPTIRPLLQYSTSNRNEQDLGLFPI